MYIIFLVSMFNQQTLATIQQDHRCQLITNLMINLMKLPRSTYDLLLNYSLTTAEVCIVPAIRRTITGTTAPNTRLSMSGDPTITIVCESGYQYKDVETSTARCDTGVDNNGFPKQCRSKKLEIICAYL